MSYYQFGNLLFFCIKWICRFFRIHINLFCFCCRLKKKSKLSKINWISRISNVSVTIRFHTTIENFSRDSTNSFRFITSMFFLNRYLQNMSYENSVKNLKIYKNQRIHFIRKIRILPVYLSDNFSITFRHYCYTK